MDFALATGLIEFAAAALTLAVMAIGLIKKSSASAPLPGEYPSSENALTFSEYPIGAMNG